MIILFRTVYYECPNSTKITKKSPFPSGVCHNIMKLSFRLFWTTDACRKPLCVVGNLTGECILPFNLESIGKSSFGFTSAYWRSDIAHGWKILPVCRGQSEDCQHCSFKPDVTIHQTSTFFSIGSYVHMNQCWCNFADGRYCFWTAHTYMSDEVKIQHRKCMFFTVIN